MWYTRGSGHNAPVFGGIEQLAGKKYTAFFEHADRCKLILNLDQAYPADAKVEKFTRRIDFTENEVSLSDKFKLAKPATATVKFFTPCKVEKISDNSLKLGGVIMTFKNIKLKSIKAAPKMTASWKNSLSEIEFQSTADEYSFNFKGTQQ